MRTHPHRRRASLEYERKNKGSKVSWMAFIESFLDWDILWLSFPPPVYDLKRLVIVCRCPNVLQLPCWMGSSQINPELSGDAVQVCDGGLNLHLYMNVDACSGAPIDMLRR